MSSVTSKLDSLAMLPTLERPLLLFHGIMKLMRRMESEQEERARRPPQTENALAIAVARVPAGIPDADAENQKGVLSLASTLCSMLELEGGMDRVRRFQTVLASRTSHAECYSEWKALREAIESEIERRYFYYIPKDRAASVLSMTADWAPVLKAFPSARKDIGCGLKCFAFDETTASVFHMMRVAEQGLRAVAKERRVSLNKDKPIDVAQWGELTTRLRAAVDKVSNWKAKDAAKKPALTFYAGVHADVVFFKDRYRNVVSHSLSHFDEDEADTVIRRVREFMTNVSSRTDESGKRVRWK